MPPMHRRGPLWSNLIVVVVKQICAGRCGRAERWSNTWLGRSGAELHCEASEDGAGKQGARLTIERVVTTLLHDAIELLRVDLAIAITVSLVDHILR